MSETAIRKCPRCGGELPGGPSGDICPRCAAALLQATQTEMSDGPTRRSFTPPSLAELAPLFPQLEVLELLGCGGMGAVYKARQKELERIAALKILPHDVGADSAFAERFSREAKALARLNHPGIVTIYDFGRANGRYYLLMEFVDGVSLGKLLEGGRVSPREALAIVPQICDALQYAHDQGIIHRDIKPENILLDRRGRAKVADFGLAKLMGHVSEPRAESGSAAKPAALTDAGKVMGTPAYMAPEQAEHPAAVDHRADIYALGVVLYQMLTGELPAKRIEPPSSKVQVDVRLDEIVLRALEKEPARRYQHVSQVKTAVETILQTPKSGAPEHPTRTAGALRWRRDHVAHVLLAAAVLVALALFPGSPWGRWVLRQVGHARGTTQIPAAPRQLSAIAARKGDIGVYLSCLGLVESSNSVTFSIAEDYVQPMFKKFDAGQPLPVVAYNRQATEEFGRGALSGLDNQIDPATGTLKCTAKLVPEHAELMLRGLFLNIRLRLETKHDVTIVPAQAIQRDSEGTFVWVITPDQKVTLRRVTVGAIGPREPAQDQQGSRAQEVQDFGNSWAEIERGLLPGEVIVTQPFKNLIEGQQAHFNLEKAGD
ncbi:putative Mitogen-activated protein kinase kinase [Verrucomicrobia bacterium]|nr:putative Mitogen-activated protein kinase kinase [Verrucomicrobiota bacterium]